MTPLYGPAGARNHDAPAAEYLKACYKQERSARSRALWGQAAIYTLQLGVIGGLLAQLNLYERELRRLAYGATTFRGHNGGDGR
jgi:hypothetical protein